MSLNCSDFGEVVQNAPGWKELNFDRAVSEMKPIVSVCVVAYQQNDYILECLESIVAQETTFEFEIIIGEDNSSDGTREKCLRFAEEHADKCRLFLHDRSNQFEVEGVVTGRFNLLVAHANARGQYIACCEGDDYWNDSSKLQKQFIFMEQNNDVSLLHTDYDWYCQSTGKLTKNFHKSSRIIFSEKYGVEEYFLNPKARTATFFFRNDGIVDLLELSMQQNWSVADTAILLFFLEKGFCGYLDQSTATYRQHSSSLSRGSSYEQKRKFLEHGSSKVKRYFATRYKITNREVLRKLDLDELNDRLALACQGGNALEFIGCWLASVWYVGISKRHFRLLFAFIRRRV